MTRRGALAACAAALILAIAGAGGDAWADETASDVLGRLEIVRTRAKDVILDIARANGLGTPEVLAANPGLDVWMPGEGRLVTLPTAHVLPDAPRSGLVVNLGDLRAYYFRDGTAVYSAPIGIGAEGTETPTGSTVIVRKVAGPTWYPPESIRAERPGLPRAVPPGPANPLGAHALYLGWPTYLLHGTNNPDGVGRRVSHGCVRFYPESIRWLYDAVPVGTGVTVVDEPVKLGRHGGELFLEAHGEAGRPAPGPDADLDAAELQALVARIEAAAGTDAGALDWLTIKLALLRRSGVPTQITRGAEHPVSLYSDQALGPLY